MIRKKIQYTLDQFHQAYQDWANEEPMLAEERVNPERIRKWHIYCAIRDGVPLTHYIDIERIERDREKNWKQNLI